ncbi:MAG: GDP-mannose 4,6-dehydratase, partial [Aquificota bacterium]
FNHESPRRGETFVTRKITRAVANILAGSQKKLYLGNLNAKRDWGFAPEYVAMMHLMLQQDDPQDYVVGAGVSHSVREFVEEAFTYAGVELEWKGEGTGEQGIVRSVKKEWSDLLKPGQVLVEVDPRYFRPTEVEFLQADITKAREILGWEPRTTFDELVKIMVDYDMQLVGLEPVGEGLKVAQEKGFGYTNHEYSPLMKVR